jgi:hypothetical protein
MVGFQADTDDASADGFPVHIMGVNFLSWCNPPFPPHYHTTVSVLWINFALPAHLHSLIPRMNTSILHMSISRTILVIVDPSRTFHYHKLSLINMCFGDNIQGCFLPSLVEIGLLVPEKMRPVGI